MILYNISYVISRIIYTIIVYMHSVYMTYTSFIGPYGELEKMPGRLTCLAQRS